MERKQQQSIKRKGQNNPIWKALERQMTQETPSSVAETLTLHGSICQLVREMRTGGNLNLTSAPACFLLKSSEPPACSCAGGQGPVPHSIALSSLVHLRQ